MAVQKLVARKPHFLPDLHILPSKAELFSFEIWLKWLTNAIRRFMGGANIKN